MRISESISEIINAEWQHTEVVKVKSSIVAGGYMDKLETTQLKGVEAMEQFLRDYTDGDQYLYGTANNIADFSLRGDNEKLDRYLNDDLIGENSRRILLNIGLLEKAMIKTDITLYRFETRSAKAGEMLYWGLRSTSADATWVENIAERGYLTEADFDKWGKRNGQPVIYEITGAKALDISAYSMFPEQQEWLVRGIFVVSEVINDGDIIRVRLEPID